jgi:hypothetical protein
VVGYEEGGGGCDEVGWCGKEEDGCFWERGGGEGGDEGWDEGDNGGGGGFG